MHHSCETLIIDSSKSCPLLSILSIQRKLNGFAFKIFNFKLIISTILSNYAGRGSEYYCQLSPSRNHQDKSCAKPQVN